MAFVVIFAGYYYLIFSNSGIKLGIKCDLFTLMNLINICLRQNLNINEGDYIAKQPN